MIRSETYAVKQTSVFSFLKKCIKILSFKMSIMEFLVAHFGWVFFLILQLFDFISKLFKSRKKVKIVGYENHVIGVKNIQNQVLEWKQSGEEKYCSHLKF